MFDGILGNYTGTEYKVELLEGAQPHHAKSFPIPKVHEETLKIEVDRLVKIGVLKRINNSELATPTYVLAKKMELFASFLILENLIKESKGDHFLFLKYRVYF